MNCRAHWHHRGAHVTGMEDVLVMPVLVIRVDSFVARQELAEPGECLLRKGVLRSQGAEE